MKKAIMALFALAALACGMLACGQGSTTTPTAAPTTGPTPTPLPLQAPGWAGVTLRTLCLEVEQSYPGLDKEPKPIVEATQRILGGLGLQVVIEPEPCDAAMTLTLTGEALGDDYVTGYCYSGAEVSGQLLLEASGYEPLTLSVSGRQHPPIIITGCPTAVQAPFEDAWPEALLGGLVKLWGYQVLIQAVGDEEVWMREAAAEALGEVGPEEGVVPALAQAVRGGSEAAARALKEIGPQAAEATPALVEVLEQNRSLTMRRLAAQALGAIGPGAVEGVPALVEALGDESATLREDAAEALGRIGPGAMDAIPALIELLGDESRFVREAAAEALAAISGQNLGANADAWQQWWEGQQ
jgi:hypothetical protein